MEPGNVDSHIQMPRFLLARFENEQHKFFYYDVKKRFIGTNGHAKSTNTEYGYYPNEIEELLNNELEQPFSRILQFIDSVDLDTQHFTMTTIDENNIKQFLTSFIVRSPLFIDDLNKNSVFFQLFNIADQHAIAITQGFAEAQKQMFFDDYRITLTVNKSTIPFILPICGLYEYSLNGYTHINLPVSPKIAITMIESAGIHSIEKNGLIHLYLINQEKHTKKLNEFAFKHQCKQQYGCVISPSKEAIEEALRTQECFCTRLNKDAEC